MKLFRVAKEQYASDLSGRGAEIHGGRWNTPGYPVVYTSTTASLALLESLAWTSMSSLLSAGFVMMVIQCPETCLHELKVYELPAGWNHIDAYGVTQKIGDAWINSKNTLLLRIPSAILSMEANMLINPKHTLMSQVVIEELFDIEFDPRVIKHLE